MVREFNGRKFLSMPKQNAVISTVADIGCIEEELDEDCSHLKDAVVVGVMSLDSFKTCFICKGKVRVTSATTGKCEKCDMSLRLDRCLNQLVAKVVVEAEELTKILSVFSPVVQDICQDNEVTEEALLAGKKFDLWLSADKVITRISRSS